MVISLISSMALYELHIAFSSKFMNVKSCKGRSIVTTAGIHVEIRKRNFQDPNQ
jgi:hypothetical protein